MKQFIELTLSNSDRKIFVNIDLIRDLFICDAGTTISFDEEYIYTVKESIIEILGDRI